MIWHELPELPKPDTEVLAEVEAHYARFIILKHDGVSWWYYTPHSADFRYRKRQKDVKRWAYIKED